MVYFALAFCLQEVLIQRHVKLLIENMQFYSSSSASYKSITLIVQTQKADFSMLGCNEERIVWWRHVQSDVFHECTGAVIPSPLLPIAVTGDSHKTIGKQITCYRLNHLPLTNTTCPIITPRLKLCFSK